MNSKVNKSCAVPMCDNTSLKTPNKLFVLVPYKKTIRDKWLKLARRDTTGILPCALLYFCEDHFDMPREMRNYMEYHVMGSVAKVHMNPGSIPTKYECQADRSKQISDPAEGLYIHQKRKKVMIEESEKDLEERIAAVKQIELGDTSSGTLVSQANIEIASQEICQSVLMSQFKPKSCITADQSTRTLHKPTRNLFTIEGKFYSNISYTAPPSKPSLQKKPPSHSSELKQEKSKILHSTVVKVLKNPLSYIGVPKSCCFLIKLIGEETNIPVKHILMCLKKIKLNPPFRELADNFSMTTTDASNVFLKTIPIIATFMRAFIVKLDTDSITTLPLALRHKYHTVSCIIDCLEIEVQNHSRSTSECKNANTVKYLISYTPNGLVHYISPGYRGVTDTCLVKSCDFVKSLQPGMCVMAVGGFTDVEQYLWTEGVQLIRPPVTFEAGRKEERSGARDTKQIVSLRIHAEKVIRRLRQFNMLKRHARVTENLVKVLGDVITVACGLINLQDLSGHD